MGGEENRRHRPLTLPLAADIPYRREPSGGTDYFDEHRKRRIADQILFVPRAARRQRDRTIEQPRHLQRNRSLLTHRWREMDSNYWSRHGETPLGRAMWFRARLHQLGEAHIPRGTKSSNRTAGSLQTLGSCVHPSHVERPVRVLVVREGSMVRIWARRPSWKALSEPRNSLRMAILPVWRSGCGSSTPPVHSRSRHLAGLCIRRLFGRAFTLIE